jgi:diguanylate cyclase (GGDEF)-like protein
VSHHGSKQVGSGVGSAQSGSTFARYDELTGLTSRGALLEQLQTRIDAGALPISVIFIELDHFSVFNDSLGYAAGDEMLRAVAGRLSVEVPNGAIVSRFDGDQFVVAVGGDLAGGLRLAGHLCERVSAKIESGVLAGLHVTCSAGVSVAEQASEAVEIVRRADIALCQAKRGGRNRVCVYDEVFAASRLRQQRLVVELERALESKDPAINMFFQPIYSLAEMRPCAVEALARWDHPKLGAVSPGEFIAAAERTGKMHTLGAQLFRIAVLGRRVWHSASTPLLLNINVSPLQLHHPDFAHQLLDLLAEFDVPTSQIACEITESILLDDDHRSSRSVRTLSDGGLRLVLDDFGTGYASLDTLMRYQFTGVKIDQSFVRNLGSSATARAIVRSAVNLADELGLTCTAEGVENDGVLDVLRDLGCPMVQGRRLCEPVSADDLRRILA